MKAAADEVVHAARSHPVERRAHHLLLAAAEQELEDRVRRELGRAAEPARTRVEHAAQRTDGFGDQRLGQRLA